MFLNCEWPAIFPDRPAARGHAAAARAAAKSGKAHLASECPLAGDHLAQVIDRLGEGGKAPDPKHPIELFAKAYGLA